MVLVTYGHVLVDWEVGTITVLLLLLVNDNPSKRFHDEGKLGTGKLNESVFKFIGE